MGRSGMAGPALGLPASECSPHLRLRRSDEGCIIMMKRATLGLYATMMTLTAASDLVISVGTQTGFFKTGDDIGGLNPHDYRPNEFVTSDVRRLTALD